MQLLKTLTTIFLIFGLLNSSYADPSNGSYNTHLRDTIANNESSSAQLRDTIRNAIKDSLPSHIHLYTLKDFINADPEIANYKSSRLISPMTGHLIQIKGSWYQIRTFGFEIQPGNPTLSQDITFKEFIEKNDLLNSMARPSPSQIFDFDFFLSTPELVEKGAYYSISLRKITDETLIKKKLAEQSKKNKNSL